MAKTQGVNYSKMTIGNAILSLPGRPNAPSRWGIRSVLLEVSLTIVRVGMEVSLSLGVLWCKLEGGGGSLSSVRDSYLTTVRRLQLQMSGHPIAGSIVSPFPV